MHRSSLRAAAVLSLLVAAGACSQNANDVVSITKTEALVSGCKKVGDVSAPSGTPDAAVNDELTSRARSAGGNYVLVAGDNARSGAAYRCEQPSAGAR